MSNKTHNEGRWAPYIMALIMLAVSLSHTVLLSPLIMRIINGSGVTNSHIISVLFYMQIFIPLISNFIGYAFIIRKIIKTSIKDALPHTLLYQAAVFISLSFSLVWSYAKEGIPASDEFAYSVLSLFLNFALAAAIMYAVVFACGAIKKRTSNERPWTLLPKGNTFLVSAFAAAAAEAVKQLVIELSYIVPTVIEIGFDITPHEAVSMLISIVFVLFVLALGYLITVSVIIISEKK